MADADRLRLAARVPADYNGFGYAPILADDMRAVAGVGTDIAAALETSNLNVGLADADRLQAGVDRAAAAASATLAAAIVPASADRTVGRRVNDAAQWPSIRATPAWGINSAGNLDEVAADSPRWDFDPLTLAPLGLAFAPARTNSITNPRAEGAVAGTPGTAPTGWGSRPSGVPNTEVIGSTTRRGVPGVLVRFWGVPTSTGAQTWQLTSSVAHTVGQVLCSSIYVELVAGTTTNLGNFGVRNNLANDGGTAFTLGAFTRLSRLWTSTVSPATPGLRWSYNDTVTPVDFTIFVGAPSLEINVPYPSSPILPPVGTPGVSTRAQGICDIPIRNLGTRYNRRAGTIILDWNSQTGPFTSAADTDFMTLVSLGDLSVNEVMGLLINPAHGSVVFRRTVGGVSQTTAAINGVTPPAAGETIRCAFAWDIDAGLMQVAARGAVGTQLTGQTVLPIITHLMPGRYSTTRPLAGRIAGMEIRPAGFFGTSLATLT